MTEVTLKVTRLLVSDGLVWIFQNQLGSEPAGMLTQPFQGFTGNGPKNQKISSEQQFVGAGGQRRMDRLVQWHRCAGDMSNV